MYANTMCPIAPPFMLVGSPRAGGNCDAIAKLMRAANAALSSPPCFLRNYQVAPCTGCGVCSLAAADPANQVHHKAEPTGYTQEPAFGCPLSQQDTSAFILQSLLTASRVCLIAPIYFYHLPAIVKALIDRLQPFWALSQVDSPLLKSVPERPCHVVLLAGRTKGDNLFTGSLLSLTYALRPLRLRLAPPLLLRGLDAPAEVLRSSQAIEAVSEYAKNLLE